MIISVYFVLNILCLWLSSLTESYICLTVVTMNIKFVWLSRVSRTNALVVHAMARWVSIEPCLDDQLT